MVISKPTRAMALAIHGLLLSNFLTITSSVRNAELHAVHAQLRNSVSAESRCIFPSDVELLEITAESHYQFGFHLGKRLRSKIHSRIQKNANLQNKLLPFAATLAGKKLFEEFFSSHNATFWEYIEELKGIADGSDVPFETIFIMNLVEEYGNSMPTEYSASDSKPSLAPASSSTLHCSDIVLYSQDLQVVVHNEDSALQDVNNTAFVVASVANGPKFLAFTYAGDLPSGAFGFNARGIGFTLNFVQPTEIDAGALGRGFISRDLLTATSYQDAMDKITRPFQSAGHNYQLMDFDTKKIWNVEVASFNRFAVRSFESRKTKVEAFFHANQYQTLLVSQPAYNSSLHRLKRYSELKPPTSIHEALTVLGDQHDHLYPIFHDAVSHARGELSGWTLATIGFDLMRGIAFLMRRNPANHEVKLVLNLSDPSDIQCVSESVSLD